MCLFPRLLKNRKYEETKKNGGNIPAVPDMRVLYVPRKCGNCMECRKQKSREWRARLMEDLRHDFIQHGEKQRVRLITLTFSNEEYKKIFYEAPKTFGAYDKENWIAAYAVKHFRERWRKFKGKSIRHWLVTELGHNGTENIHLHGLIWTNETEDFITKRWQYGFIRLGKWVNESTINYSIKYVHKIDKDHPHYKSRVFTSGGIGAGYIKRMDADLNKYNENGETKETYTTRQGTNIGLPTYWRNKIYTEEEREKLWIQKLDKKERWINGVKYDISKTEQVYFKALKQAQELNAEKGFMGDKIEWDKRKYEQDRHKMLMWERVKGNASGGVIQKGLDYIVQPPIDEDTGDVERRKGQIYRRKHVAPAAGCEYLHKIVDNLIWKDGKWSCIFVETNKQ